MAARQDYRSVVPAGDGQQRWCARGDWCAASTRDTEGTWHPALTWQPYCGTCTAHIVTCLTELPPLYGLLTAPPPALARPAGRRSRVPPGPRIHVSAAADALARETAAILGGWAARVRAVPGVHLSPPRHPLRSPERAREDCLALARNHGPLMALAYGWTTRVYDLPEVTGAAAVNAGAPGLRWLLPDSGHGTVLDRAAGTCRKCGRKVTRSPVSGWWWAHGGQATEFCDHDPGRVPVAEPPVPVTGEVGFRHGQPEDIGDGEIVSIGDGWVKVMRHLNALHAGAEILELHWHARRVTGQVPAAADVLDGMPCRSCEAMSSLVLLELPPPDPREKPPPVARCCDCGDEMTRLELTGWAAQYAAWVQGSGILTCRRCDLADGRGRVHECCWAGCACCGGKRRRAA